VSARLPPSVAAPTFQNTHWRWSDAPVLYPAAAAALQLNVSDTDAVIRYLVEH